MMRRLDKNARPKAAARVVLGALMMLAPLMGMARSSLAASLMQPEEQVIRLDVNKGLLLRLEAPVSNIFIANPKVADVQIKSPTLVYLFGTGEGETSFYAVDRNDKIVYSASVAVAQNIGQIKDLVKAVVPQAEIDVKTFNGLVLLSGYVQRPEDAEQLVTLAQKLVGEGQTVVNRLQVTTPTQVNLHVKFAELARDTLKQLGFNWETSLFGSKAGFLVATGRNVFDRVPDPLNPLALQKVFPTLANGADTIAGDLVTGNLDLNYAIDALESEGFVSVLAEPNLTALSGETATFLAGGEFPIPVPSLDKLVVEFKEFGVGLSFTPTVMADDRISLRVRPEVSQLSTDAAISVNGISIPALTSRRAETTVELGSGQSFAIAGLLQNNLSQSVRKFPGLGNLPILGALFKSDRFQNRETELVIVITPYLVKPTDKRRLLTPMEGKRNPTDIDRYLRGETFQAQPTRPSPPPSSPNSRGLVGPAGFSLAN